MSMRVVIGMGALTFALILCGPALAPGGAALASAVWGDLEPGPHAVGFMAVEKYDYSRSFEAKKDYFGTSMPGERGRPVQVCIWYPATIAESDPHMVYGEYAFVYPEDGRLYMFLGGLQDREVGVLHFVFNNDRGAVIDLQSEEMMAVRGAAVATGRFPLILYAPNFNSSFTENLILCEYLASHGFVVASTHAYGPRALRSGQDGAAVEMLISDLGFVLATMHDFDFVDHDRLGVMGGSAGALAGLLFQMENLYVDALAGFNAAFLNSGAIEMAGGNPRFDIRAASVPMLQVYGGAQEGRDVSMLDSLEYSERYALAFNELPPLALTSYRMFLATVFVPNEMERLAYEAACVYARNFFDAELNGNESAGGFLAASPEENGLDPAAVTLSQMEGRDVPPTEEQFMAIIRERGVEEAVEVFETFRAEDPDLVLFQENVCNFAGYGLLQRGQAREAVAVFKMNAETYPASANTWDSLAEACLAAGDTEHATECYRKVLEALPDDPRATDEIRDILRTNAEGFLENPGGEEGN
jgi:tetratricopeptide (TPR) repeat protein